jgi:hypothetical protein
MGRLEEAAKLLRIRVEQLPAEAARRYNEPSHTVAWMQNTLHNGSMPGLVAKLLDEVLVPPPAPPVPLVQPAPAASSNLEAA